MSLHDRQIWGERMRQQIERQLQKRPATDAKLAERAARLNDAHFGGRLIPRSVGWFDFDGRWADCSGVTGDIRIARRAMTLPEWVIDYLLVHELAHLEHLNHGPAFWQLVNRYPLTERARGFLLAVDAGAASFDGPPRLDA